MSRPRASAVMLAGLQIVLCQPIFETLVYAGAPAGPSFQSHSIKFMEGLAAFGAGVVSFGRFDIAEEAGCGALVRIATVNKALAGIRLALFRRAKEEIEHGRRSFTATFDMALTAAVPPRRPGARIILVARRDR